MKVLQINSVDSYGSTGKIVSEIHQLLIKKDVESFVAYGRKLGSPSQESYRIGTNFDFIFHILGTRITDRHGLFSKKATQNFLKKIEEINPDIIHIHNIHGYYINYPELFSYINLKKTPLVWTLHDCWSFTGHCSHFEYVGCEKWKTYCTSCEQINQYPKTFADQSFENFKLKKKIFSNVENLTLVPVSKWLFDTLENSFQKNQTKILIQNGIDLKIFKPQNKISNYIKSLNFDDKKIILAVSSIWDHRKGLDDLIRLAERLHSKSQLVIIGLTPNQLKTLPKNIKGLERTENICQLVDLYSYASVVVNTTLEDTFPTVNLEALASGTPVVTYNSGGSPESIDEDTGIVVEKSNIIELNSAIEKIIEKPKMFYQDKCRARAEKLFDKSKNFEKYLNLYQNIISNNENTK